MAVDVVDPVAKCRVRGCQPCRAALPPEGLTSRAPLVAATSTPNWHGRLGRLLKRPARRSRA